MNSTHCTTQRADVYSKTFAHLTTDRRYGCHMRQQTCCYHCNSHELWCDRNCYLHTWSSRDWHHAVQCSTTSFWGCMTLFPRAIVAPEANNLMAFQVCRWCSSRASHTRFGSPALHLDEVPSHGKCAQDFCQCVQGMCGYCFQY